MDLDQLTQSLYIIFRWHWLSPVNNVWNLRTIQAHPKCYRCYNNSESWARLSKVSDYFLLHWHICTLSIHANKAVLWLIRCRNRLSEWLSHEPFEEWIDCHDFFVPLTINDCTVHCSAALFQILNDWHHCYSKIWLLFDMQAYVSFVRRPAHHFTTLHVQPFQHLCSGDACCCCCQCHHMNTRGYDTPDFTNAR